MKINHKFRLATICVAAVANASCFAADTAAGDTLQYRPPLRGAPAKRVGGATRALFDIVKSPVTLIAPSHVGLTFRSQPTVYWHLEQPSAGRMVFRLISLDTETTVVERPLPDATCAGLYRENLAAAGLTLKPNVTYRWQVAVVAVDQQVTNPVSSGTIRYTTTDAPPVGLATLSRSARLSTLAEAGIWYDTVDELMAQMKSPDANASSVGTFGNLLGQVGIPDNLAKSAICY